MSFNVPKRRLLFVLFLCLPVFVFISCDNPIMIKLFEPVMEKKMGDVEIDISPELDEWDLIDKTAQVNANTDLVFTVTEYKAYQWYVDGKPVGTSSSYTFNQIEGVYILTVVVTNDAGEKRSGTCCVTVQ